MTTDAEKKGKNAAFYAKRLNKGLVSNWVRNSSTTSNVANLRTDSIRRRFKPMASRSEILALFRSLYRTARQFPDYNIRQYVKRRTVDGFRQNREVADAAAALEEGKAQLEAAKRQAVVYSLYAPKVKSIMEVI